MEGDKREKGECCKGECHCCESMMKVPSYFKCERSRCAFMKTICKEEAKRYCCLVRMLNGLGMGMGLWVPEMCDGEELKAACCAKECAAPGCEPKSCAERAAECVKNPDCLTKKLLECSHVPQYIKDCPLLLCMFKREVVKQHAKQCFRFACMKKGCCKEKCCKDKCCMDKCCGDKCCK